MTALNVLLPGNPFIPGLYDGFANDLGRHLGPGEVRVLAHRGQGPEDDPGSPAAGLAEVIEAHRRTLLDLVARERPRGLCLLGHSLGATVAVELYRELSAQVETSRLILICPFVGPAGRNRLLLQALSRRHIRVPLVALCRRLLATEAPSRLLLQRGLKLGAQAGRVRHGLRREGFLSRFAHLVGDYQAYFAQRDPGQAIAALPTDDVLWLFAPRDFWAPPALRRTLPAGARRQVLEDIEHGFCLHPAQCRSVARACADFLGNDRA